MRSGFGSAKISLAARDTSAINIKKMFKVTGVDSHNQTHSPQDGEMQNQDIVSLPLLSFELFSFWCRLEFQLIFNDLLKL